MATNQQNRQAPKPKIPGGVNSNKPSVNPETLEEAHIPDKPVTVVESVSEEATELNLEANAPIVAANKEAVARTIAEELADAKARLADIRAVVNNPFHIVGYLVNRDPIVTILERPRVSTTGA